MATYLKNIVLASEPYHLGSSSCLLVSLSPLLSRIIRKYAVADQDMHCLLPEQISAALSSPYHTYLDAAIKQYCVSTRLCRQLHQQKAQLVSQESLVNKKFAAVKAGSGKADHLAQLKGLGHLLSDISRGSMAHEKA